MKTNLKRLFKYFHKNTILLIVALIINLISVLLTLFIPVVNGLIIDLFISSDINNKLFYKYYIFLAIIIILSALFTYISSYMMNILTNKLLVNLRKDAFYKLERMNISDLESYGVGDILLRFTSDIEEVSSGLITMLNTLVSGLLTIIVTLVYMFILNYIVALIVLLLTPLSLLSASIIAKKSFKTLKERSKIRADISSHVTEIFDFNKEVISYNYQDEAIKKYEDLNEKLAVVGFKAQFLGALVNPVTRFVNSIVYAVVALFGSILVIKTRMSVGSLTVFLSYAQSYTKPFNDISNVFSEMQTSFASLNRIFELIDYEITEENESNIIDFRNDIEFKNVCFSYDESKKVIDDLNLTIKGKTKVSIVGKTGSGKTTLINLLLRFYDIDSGEIIIDNKNINSCTKEYLRENIGVILQEPFIFKGTILENIKYGKLEATREEVIKASKASYADSFINNLKDGYDTYINDENLLSNGEKQLICIARLMLKNSNLLILDEATSNIDLRTESLINKGFNNLFSNKTTIIIAHRLATILNSDLILVFKDGKIVESGTHLELLEKNGYYKEIFDTQFEK